MLFAAGITFFAAAVNLTASVGSLATYSGRSDHTNAGENVPTPGVYLVAVADKSFQKRYAPMFQAMDTYANRYGYNWTIIGKQEAQEDEEVDASARYDCSKYQVYFFKKHCMVAQWTLRNTNSGDSVFVFDSDVAPYRTQTPLDFWMDLFVENDVVFYDRSWNPELMAGNYMVRNNAQALDFLVGWADWEFEIPPGFSSADNGAIHVHLLRVLGFDPHQVCYRQYKNLTALVTDMGERNKIPSVCARYAHKHTINLSTKIHTGHSSSAHERTCQQAFMQ